MDVQQARGRAATQACRVRGHPVIVILDANGEVAWSRAGVQPRLDLIKALESALAVETQ